MTPILFIREINLGRISHKLFQKSRDAAVERFRVAQLALPDCQNAPSAGAKRCLIRGVAGAVAGDFQPPILPICLRRPRAARAVMAMPKTPMHEDDFSPAWKHQIGAACQIPAMKPVSVALGVEHFPQEQFGGCVLAFHGLHGAPAHRRSFHAA